MNDIREAILERLEALLGTVSGIANVYRDRGDADSFELPAAWILDGSEVLDNVDELIRNKSVYMPNVIMTLRPSIVLITKPRDDASNSTVGGVSAPIGPEISEWRVLILNAIINDETLVGLLTTSGQIAYHGCDTDMVQDNVRRGFLQMHFSFHYPLFVSVDQTPQPRP